MLDDIDYGDLSATAEPAPKKKSAISERKLSSKSESKPTPKPIDTGALADRATGLQEGLGAPEIGDPLAQYGLPGLGVLGGLATAYGLYQASKSKPSAPVTPPSVVGGVPAASSVQYTTAGAQPTMQYGKQTMNAPVGVPAPADIPPAPPSIDEQIKMERLKQAQLRTAALEKASQPKPAGTPVAAAETVANVAPETAKPAPTVADLAARVEAGKQAGLGLKKAETPAEVPAAPITSPTLEQAVDKPVEGAVAPKTRAAKRTPEQMTAAAAEKGINMYRNMFGFDSKDPTSTKSLAAIETANRFIAEGMEGKIPGSRDLLLNPVTDVGASGKKFYSGTPEGYRNAYIPWLEKNLNTLPPETQSHILSSMTKGQTKDLTKIMKGLGIAGTALGAYETAFAAQQGKYGEAALRGADVATDFIPVVSQIKQGLAPQGAAAPGVPLERFEEAYKLGSPYAQTKEAKKSRLKEKAGAGRGIAPPSAYMR